MYGSTFSSLFNLTCLSFSFSSFPLPSLVDVYCPHNYCGSCVDFMFIVIVFIINMPIAMINKNETDDG